MGLMGAGVGVAFALQNAGEVQPSAPPAAQTPTPPAAQAAPPASGRGEAPATALTPMGERVAVIGILNKRNGLSRDLTMKPGQALRVGDLVVRLRACERTAPWEHEQLTGAFVQVDVKDARDDWGRVFSGWVYKETPSLNVVEHPIYDVWPKSCAMRFPEIGPDTESFSNEPQSGDGPSRASSSNAT